MARLLMPLQVALLDTVLKTSAASPRVCLRERIGRFPAWTGLDHLPALTGVWHGVLSLIGPRLLRGWAVVTLERG